MNNFQNTSYLLVIIPFNNFKAAKFILQSKVIIISTFFALFTFTKYSLIFQFPIMKGFFGQAEETVLEKKLDFMYYLATFEKSNI